MPHSVKVRSWRGHRRSSARFRSTRARFGSCVPPPDLIPPVEPVPGKRAERQLTLSDEFQLQQSLLGDGLAQPVLRVPEPGPRRAPLDDHRRRLAVDQLLIGFRLLGSPGAVRSQGHVPSLRSWHALRTGWRCRLRSALCGLLPHQPRSAWGEPNDTKPGNCRRTPLA